MTFQDRLDITTAEGVTVSMTIAGIGSRTLAWLLDGIIIAVALTFLGFATALTVDVEGLLAVGLVTLATLFVPMAYLVGMETLNGGRTVGKMAAGLKVVKVTGAPVGFGSAVVRTLFLPVDILLFGVGIIAMFVTQRSQRLGDLAARTVVVRDRIASQSVAPVATSTDDGHPRWDVSAITEEEIGAIRSFLTRAAGLPPPTRAGYASQLRARLEPRIGGADPSLPDEQFLTRVVIEKNR